MTQCRLVGSIQVVSRLYSISSKVFCPVGRYCCNNTAATLESAVMAFTQDFSLSMSIISP